MPSLSNLTTGLSEVGVGVEGWILFLRDLTLRPPPQLAWGQEFKSGTGFPSGLSFFTIPTNAEEKSNFSA